MLQSKRTVYLIVLVGLIPIGLLTKAYHGPAQAWMHDYAGGIIYTMFFVFLFIFISPGSSPKTCSIAACCFSTLIEFTQLSRMPLLETIRSTFLGRTIIGTSFNPVDILYYVLGAILGFLLLITIENHMDSN